MTLELQVCVIEAKIDLFGEADLSVILQLSSGGRTEQTVTRQQILVPLWPQTFHFPITSIQTKVLLLHLMDANDIGADHPISTPRWRP
jgi:hypothetical protein